MTKSRLIAAFIALFALAIPATASATDALDPQQWGLTNSSTAGQYLLFNQQINKPVGHGSRTWGVDLDWGQEGGYWRFLRANRDHRGGAPIGEPVAMYNTKARKYLIYGSQTFGINLKWSSSPRYEWRLEKPSSAGGLALYNLAQKDHVVYGKRSTGINLRWLKDLRKEKGQGAVGSIHDASVFMTAQPPVQGYVPFLGSYGGGGTKAVLTKVANPANGAPLRFIKPGRSSSQCGQDDAVIKLGPGQTMTADQMKTLWSSATPSLASAVPFLACAATQFSTVWVNVQYRITG
jgi:hypothetical protein